MSFSLEDAEHYLLSLELFGMRFGLDRMRRLMTALGHPERRFESIHVVGTNGKSSTVRMIAAILTAHGLRTGAYLSPHLSSFVERIRIDDADLDDAAFAAAVQRAAHAAELVDHSLAPGDRVTQFEALTAAAYSELATQGVEVAVIEAGLGGRYDATNVIPSQVQVLTTVGLEHTRWLGPTITDIAGEKLDVVQPGGTLVLGHGLHPDAERVAEAVAAERGARIVHAGIEPDVIVGALGTFQRRNFALARAAAEAYLGELDPAAVAHAAAQVRVPGRLQIVDTEPLTLVDGAHNPDGMRALAESLSGDRGRPRPRRRRRLDPRRQGRGRDAGGAPSGVRSTRPHEQSESPRLAAAHAAVAGGPASRSAVGDCPRSPRGAAPRARDRRRRWRRYLYRLDLSRGRSAGPCRAPPRLDAVNEREDRPSFLTMIGLVALIVAVVILVFFGIGYLFGRLFL